MKHVNQLKKAIRIEAIYSKNSSWFNANAQIDLLIDRDDNVMNLCEIKFHKSAFSIDKNYYLNLKNKISELQKETKTKKNIFITMITTHGVKENEYSIELIENKIDINKLFM